MSVAQKFLSAALVALAGAYTITRFFPQATILQQYFLTTASSIFLAILLFIAAYNVFVYPFYVSPLRHLPEPKGAKFPFAHAYRLLTEPNGTTFRDWALSVPNSGLIRFRVLWNTERVLVTGVEAMREVMLTNATDWLKPDEATFLMGTFIGKSVLIAEGEEHKRQRKLLMPAFAFRHIKDLYPIFWSKSRESALGIAHALRSTSSNVQDAYVWAQRATLDIIGLSGMGQDFNSLADPHGEATTTYHDLFNQEPPFFYWCYIGIAGVPFPLLFSLPIPQVRTPMRSVRKIKEITHQLLDHKRAAMAKGQRTEVDILAVMLESGGFTDAELVGQAMTFLAAGHETTASALCWAIYLLAQHPGVQPRLRREIRANLPSLDDAGATVTAATLDRLPYLNAVASEVLRHHPPVPTTMRRARKPMTLNGVSVPAGTDVYLSPWSTNVDPELWGDDAEEFKPERWLSEDAAGQTLYNGNGGAKSNFALLTFLHGPRACIGKDFARGEFLCLLAAWIGRFEVELEEPKRRPGIVGYITLRPRGGIPVQWREVEGW